MPKYFLDMDYQQATASAATNRKEHVFIASDGAIMRSRRRLNPAGWQLDAYHRNPVVLENHDFNQLPIGKARAWVADAKLYAGVTFARSARAQEIEQLVEDGIIRAVSVGWLPAGQDAKPITDGSKLVSIDFNAQELIEISVVTVPDNANAVKVAAANHDDQAATINAIKAAFAQVKEALASGNRRS